MPDTSPSSPVTQLGAKGSASGELAVFPNPFNRDFYVNFQLEKEENVQLVLMDIAGAVWQQHNKKLPAGTQAMRIYADVPAGSYVVKVQTGNKVLSATVIKQ